MYATIDIGTNSTLLLVAEVLPDKKVRVVEDKMTVTRLGAGLSRMGNISPDSKECTLNAISDYINICRSHGVKKISIVGTAALRTAKNAGEFIFEAEKIANQHIEVLGGEREAELTYKAAVHDFGNDIIVIDIGGGSTEFIGTDKKKKLIMKSLNIGCVNLTEQFLISDPVGDIELSRFRSKVRFKLESNIDFATFARPNDRELVATSGTATSIASMVLKLSPYDANRVHGFKLKIDELRNIIDELKFKSLEERKKIRGLDPKRADVIAAGAGILHEAMSVLGFATVTVSDRGLKWGLLYELAEL